MSKNTDKVKFTIYFNLSKDKNGNWSLDEVSESDEDKILGIYEYQIEIKVRMCYYVYRKQCFI